MVRTSESSSEPPADSPAADGATAVSGRVWWTAILYIATAAMLLRFYDLPLKPLHHDEGVNALFVTRLVRPPHVFHYDPTNYHGPTLFYLAWASVSALGLTTVALRMVTALAGFGSVLLLLGLRRSLGSVGALAAAVLLAVSPGAVYLSRYFIHEMLLVGATIGLIVAIVRWWQSRRRPYVYLASLSVAFMFATKETAIISVVVLIIATVLAMVWCELRRSLSAGQRITRSVTSAVSDTARRTVAGVRQRVSPLATLGAIALFVAINVLFYTSFLTNPHGVIDALSTFAVWAKTGTVAHTQPWWTYVGWLAEDELPLLVIGASGAVLALWDAKNVFTVFASFWAIGILAAYSIIPYKTPWLTLNIVAPLAVTGGSAVEQIWQRRGAWARIVRVAVCAVAVYAGVQAVLLSFVDYDDESRSYVYAQTSRQLLRLVREVDDLETLNPGATIAVTSQHQFPLSWYLRWYPAGYYRDQARPATSLVIASHEQQLAGDVPSHEQYDQIGTYQLRPGVRLLLFARRDLKRPSPSTRHNRVPAVSR